MSEDRYELIKPALLELDKLIERYRKFTNLNRWMMIYCFGTAAICALDWWSTEDPFCGLAVLATSLVGALNYFAFRMNRTRHRAGVSAHKSLVAMTRTWSNTAIEHHFDQAMAALERI